MIPQLRFSQFTDKWQKVQISDVADKGQYGMNAAAIPFDGVNGYLRITDIDDETRRILANGLTSPAGQLDDKYLLKQNDIVIARTGASTGKSYLYANINERMYFAGFLIRFRVNKANPYFVYLQTLRKPYGKWISAVSARSGQPGVNSEEYGTYSFYAPSIKEQEKIAEFLTVVDERIEKIDKKLKLLQQYKKGVMQKIFTQEIRFKDENGNLYPDWQTYKLTHVYDFISTNSLSRDQLSLDVDGYKNIHYGDIHTKFSHLLNTIIDEASIPRIISGNRILLADGFGSTVVQVGDVIMADASEDHKDIGKSLEIVNTDGDTVAGLHTILMRPSKNIQLGFGAYLFNSQQVHEQIAKMATGVSVLGISKANLSKVSLSIPFPEEQQKIVTFLTALDDKIKAEQTRLTTAKQWKKGLLQRMFI